MSKYKDDLSIDKFNLDKELVSQAQLFMSYGEDHAEAVAERDLLKRRLEVERAQKALLIRKQPDEYGFTKVTDKAVEALIDTDKDIVALENIFIEARKQVMILDTAKEAFDQRRSTLIMLCKLYLGEYAGDPTVSSKDVEEKEPNLRANLREARKRRNGGD